MWPSVTKNEIEVDGLNSLSPWKMSELASFRRNQHHSAWMFKKTWRLISPSNENWKNGDEVLFWLSSLLAVRIQTVTTKMKRTGELRAVSFKLPMIAKQCSFFHCDGCVHQSHVDGLASVSSTIIFAFCLWSAKSKAVMHTTTGCSLQTVYHCWLTN